jgi:hypothetical protein
MGLERPFTPGLGSRLFGSSRLRALDLLRAMWPLAVGSDLARRTELVVLEGTTLRVRVPDARWRKELHRMQPQILARLRASAGDLAPRRLGFMEGGLERPAGPPDASRGATPARPSVTPPPEAVTAAADAILDPELRTRFLEAAARYLARASAQRSSDA